MHVGKTTKWMLALGAGALAAAATLLTYSRGRGQCSQCGYAGDLHAYKHYGWTTCLSCWQARGKYACPSCGQGNP